MSFLPLLVLWLQPGFPQALPATVLAESPNVVRICSQIAGDCTEIPAAVLEPQAGISTSAGLTAFVDPETGALVAPTAEQLEELAVQIRIDESMRQRQEPLRAKRLPDGTLKLGTGYAVEQRATVEDEKEQHP